MAQPAEAPLVRQSARRGSPFFPSESPEVVISLIHRVEVPSIADDRPRPRWSVLIPVFNCGPYLEDALRSVLAQDPGPDRMEIIVVDDHSTTGDPEAVVRAIGGSRVRFIRQAHNIGKVRNYETGLLASRGHLIHQLHGDDMVEPGFYDEMARAFDAFPQAGAFFCESRYVNEAGRVTGRTGRPRVDTGLLDGWLETMVTGQQIQTPSMVVRREVYEQLGGFERRLDAFEDWEMWIRIATAFPVGFVARTLADYRVSSTSNTAMTMLNGTRVGSLRAMLRIVDEYLPADLLDRCRTARDRGLAQYLTQFIPFLMERREYRAVANVYGEVLTFSRHPRVLYRALYFTWNYRKLLRV